MCVPVDDPEDYNDLQLDFSNKNHTFSLDNVSYISKDNNLKKNGKLDFQVIKDLHIIAFVFRTAKSCQ